MSARLIDLEYSKLHPTIRNLSEAGVTDEDAAWIRQGANAALVACFIHERRKIPGIVIDCDADPYVPDGWTVEKHKKGGQLTFAAADLQHFYEDHQDVAFTGPDFCKEIEDKLVLNANILDFLLKNPEIIPRDWKFRQTCFWGTIYRGPGGRQYVRYLVWDGGHWKWEPKWIGGAL